jgi:phage-related protein
MADVIQFPQSHLKLREISSDGVIGVLSGWLGRNPEARARFRVRVTHLAKFPRAEWTKKQFRHIRGDLYEIKWEAGNKAWRAMGFDDLDGYFVVVLGCTHKDDVYDPSRCIDTAAGRIKETKNGEWKVIPYSQP